MRFLILSDIDEIILEYLSYEDIENIISIIDVSDNIWKKLIIRDFSKYVYDLNVCESTWYNFYKYLRFMKFGEASIANISMQYEIYNQFGDYDYYYEYPIDRLLININPIYKSLYSNDYVDHMKLFYEAICNLSRGDMVVINDRYIYFIDIVDNQKILRDEGNHFEITIVPKEFIIFDEFPPLYWRRALNKCKKLWTKVLININIDQYNYKLVDDGNIGIFNINNVRYAITDMMNYDKEINSEYTLFLQIYYNRPKIISYIERDNIFTYIKDVYTLI